MTLDEYRDLQLEDELKIGYDVEEELPDGLEDDSWIDGLLTLSLIHISEPTRPY